MSAPVDHPPPWEWSDHGLFDAADNVLIEIGYTELPWSNSDHAERITFASKYVEVATAAAGEMEALLRDLNASQSIVMDGETDEQRRHRFDGLRRAIMGAGPILQRLDAARKAGG